MRVVGVWNIRQSLNLPASPVIFASDSKSKAKEEVSTLILPSLWVMMMVVVMSTPEGAGMEETSMESGSPNKKRAKKIGYMPISAMDPPPSFGSNSLLFSS